MATAKTTKSKLPNPNKSVKSARKSAQTLKTTSRSKSAKVVPIMTEDLSAQIETLKADLAELTATAKSRGLEIADVKTREIRDTATAKAELAKAKYDNLTAETEAKIRANPLTSVAIAVGAGLFLGALTRR